MLQLATVEFIRWAVQQKTDGRDSKIPKSILYFSC